MVLLESEIANTTVQKSLKVLARTLELVLVRPEGNEGSYWVFKRRED